MQSGKGSTKCISCMVAHELSHLLLLKEKLNEHVPDSESFDIGYIEPSRQGIRGKTRWIFDHQDIDDMYKAYESAKKKEIILWCEGRKKESSDSKRASKRPSSEQQSSSETQKKARTSCNEKNAKTLHEINVIYKKLSEKHTGKFHVEQLRMWAHLVSIAPTMIPLTNHSFVAIKSQKKV